MPIQVWSASRPKNRPPVWACRVKEGETIVFDSAWVSVRLLSQAGAIWLAELVQMLHIRGGFSAPPGHGPTPSAQVLWHGDLRDDCSATIGGYFAHAEHMSGPRRGGIWYCSVQNEKEVIFHTAVNCDIQPRNGEAARWLCELTASAGRHAFADRFGI